MTINQKQTHHVSTVVQTAIDRYGSDHESLVPILSEVNQALGYLSTDALTRISHQLKVPGSQVLSTASFYRMLSTIPHGQHTIQFCESAPCHVMGGRQVLEILQEELGIAPGETTADGQWTLTAISCPGICGVGPVMMIDDNVYGNLTPKRILEILDQVKGVSA